MSTTYDRLRRIQESIEYYAKQNKRLEADYRLRKIFGENGKHLKYIRDNDKRIEKLKNYYAQVASQIRQEEKIKRAL